MKKEKVIVFGGLGFIGRYTCDKLIKYGYNVSIVDNLDPQIHTKELFTNKDFQNLIENCKVTITSVSNTSHYLNELSDATYVIYLPSATGTGQSMYKIKNYVESNLMELAALIELIGDRQSDNKVKRIILSSSRAVYGESYGLCPKHGRMRAKHRDIKNLENKNFMTQCTICDRNLSPDYSNENDICDPISIYGSTKLAQELILKNFCEAHNINYTIFRYQNVYGRGQSMNNPYTGILSIFVNNIQNERPIQLFEDGLSLRDFVNVDTIAEYNCRALQNNLPYNVTCNVGSGIGITIKDFVKQIYSASNKITPTLKPLLNYRKGDIRNGIADLSFLRKQYGDYPEIPLNEGIKQFCDHSANYTNTLSQSDLNQSFEEMKSKGLMS